jgi:hypothetical protein
MSHCEWTLKIEIRGTGMPYKWTPTTAFLVQTSSAVLLLPAEMELCVVRRVVG